MAVDRKPESPLTVGIAGLGTVGAGVIELLQTNADILAKHCPRPIVVTAVSARDKGKDRGLNLAGIDWVDDAVDLADHPKVDVVVEVIGGSEGKAKDLIEKAIANKRHVVTANKALLAHHGTALALAAERAGVALAYEAAVAGGIPVIKAMREGLAANRIDRVYGILNGTCNYILTQMRETGREFADVLGEADAGAPRRPRIAIGHIGRCLFAVHHNPPDAHTLHGCQRLHEYGRHEEDMSNPVFA